jgi:hypothetical protein
MHRSGTSLITRLLNLSGLYLGQEGDMEEPAADNPEGYWENRKFVAINNALLAALGAGWDYAPGLGALEALEPERLRKLGDQGRLLLREFEGCEPWGWKDPRNSLLVPFWGQLLPDLRFVICLRNPLDVAASLYRRNGFSLPRSLTLWKEYNERLLGCTRPECRVITHYDGYFGDAEPELTRVSAFFDLTLRDESLQACAQATRNDLRHNHAYLHQLLDESVPAGVFELYVAMCEEAGWHEGGGRSASASTDREQLLAASVQAELGATCQDQTAIVALRAELDHLAWTPGGGARPDYSRSHATARDTAHAGQGLPSRPRLDILEAHGAASQSECVQPRLH